MIPTHDANAQYAHKSAELSDCGLYRYLLTRRWKESGPYDDEKHRISSDTSLLWIMLNPSKADAEINDPTVKNVVAFSKLWSFDAATIVNLFALRTPYPAALKQARRTYGQEYVIGKANKAMLTFMIRSHKNLVFAWSRHASEADSDYVRSEAAAFDRTPMCLGHNKNGTAKHPLMVSHSTVLVPYYKETA